MKTFFISLMFVTNAFAAKSAILFIGDGMNQPTITAARVHFLGPAGRLAIDTFPHTAFIKTYSSDRLVTESAAAGTSLATGEKVASDVISKKGGKNLLTIAEWAHQSGRWVGIVTTTRITHATPAVFYAHIEDRNREADIARQLLASPFEFFLGGGGKYFQAAKRTWKVLRTKDELKTLGAVHPPTQILGVFNDDHLSYESKRAQSSSEPTLQEMAAAAVSYLSKSPKGFFLMVEGGRIDHAEHDNDIPNALGEMIAFDRTIGSTLERIDPRDTMVLVTADHGTGGLSFNGYPRTDEKIDRSPYLTFASGPKGLLKKSDAAHTGEDVPLYGFGAGADAVHGTFENTEVFRILREALSK